MAEPSKRAPRSNSQVIFFVVVLSFICATILSVMASALKKPQEIAQELDRSRQMLIAARILTHAGYFQVQNEEGEYIRAKYDQGKLVPNGKEDYATGDQILEIYQKRIIPYLVNQEGELVTFEDAGINQDKYLTEHKKEGYYEERYKLIYEILPNPKNGEEDKTPNGYVIPVNGFGLWDAIYGYIAIKPDGDTVIGISWYQQKETPGLGADIADAPWQKEFYGKKIFQPSPDGETDFQSAPIGITVVKGKVAEVLGDTPKAKTAVDGISGATLTGNGVTEAYKKVLSAYRDFFIRIHKEEEGKDAA